MKHSTVQGGIRHGGVKSQSRVVIAQRLVEAAQGAKCQRPVIKAVRRLGGCTDADAVGDDGLFMAAQSRSAYALVEVRPQILRLYPNGLLKAAMGKGTTNPSK